MRVFVTGASGWVGSAVTRQLTAKGHAVTGLARSDTAAAAVEAVGGTPLRGELGDLDRLADAAKRAEAVVHCGFIHDFSNFAHSVAVDRQAIETLGEALAGTGHPLVVTSGTAGLTLGRPSTEADAPDVSAYGQNPRVSEQTGLALSREDRPVMVIRLPPTVHGRGDHGFVASLVDLARRRGASGYVGDGANVWPAVHREDAAAAYVLALEHGKGGTRYHAVAEEGIPFRDIATIIGRKLGLPVVSVPEDKAMEHFGWIGRFVGMNVPASSALTREWLGWQPTGPGLKEDLESGGYVG